MQGIFIGYLKLFNFDSCVLLVFGLNKGFREHEKARCSQFDRKKFAKFF